MYSLCPHCSTCFRITSEQINAAQGNVRCGNCGAVFNALDNPAPEPDPSLDSPFSENEALSSAELFHHDHHDDDLPLDEEREPGKEEEDFLRLFEEPEFIPLGEEPGQRQPEIADTDSFSNEAFDPLPDEKTVSVPLPEEIDEEIHEYFVDDVENTTIEELEKLFLPEEEEEPQTETAEAPAEEKNIPVRIEETTTEPSKEKESSALASILTNPILLSIGSLLLILTLLGQYLYFARDHLAQRHVELRPLLEAMCEHLGCTLPLRRDLSKLQITHRDVRTHPTVKNALLINATFVNRAPFRQPYPAIELKLSNINGKLIGKRIFKPEEYLAGQPDIEAGIPPNTQVYLVLELADPGRQAVNFEFDFR